MSGTEVQIPIDRLKETEVRTAAEKHYKVEVNCFPCLFGTGSVSVGWQIYSKRSAEVIGYMSIVSGKYQDYPDDFEYGIITVVPLGKKWAQIFAYKLRFISDKIEIFKTH